MSEECCGDKDNCDKDPCCKDEGVIDCQNKPMASCCPEALAEDGPAATNACCRGDGSDTCDKE